jgi:hypothetical protein
MRQIVNKVIGRCERRVPPTLYRFTMEAASDLELKATMSAGAVCLPALPSCRANIFGITIGDANGIACDSGVLTSKRKLGP